MTLEAAVRTRGEATGAAGQVAAVLAALESPDGRRLIAAAITAVGLALIVRIAWFGDDAAITMRTVLNFINGYGAVFNVDERVQAYTHPLWFLLLSAATILTGNVFAATFALGIACSVAVLWVVTRHVAASATTAALAGAALLSSKAFLDYTTSGLENPLSHLLLLAFVGLAAAAAAEISVRRTVLLALVGSGLYLTRPDLLALMLPVGMAVAVAFRRRPFAFSAAVLVGAIPAVLWTLFSVVYYGAAFPNTAYAKLGGGPDLGDRLGQGMLYLADSLSRDPLTLTTVALAVVVGLRAGGLGPALAAGILLHLGYVVAIGGDFMSGRFLTAAFLVAVVILIARPAPRAPLVVAALALVPLAALSIASQMQGGLYSKLSDDRQFGHTLIADERQFYDADYGLLSAPPGQFSAPAWTVGNRTVQAECGIGYVSILTGPGNHVIDRCALADPLLARLPGRYVPAWRIGHFVRDLPVGYVESVATGVNVIADPEVHALYDAVRAATRGPLTDRARLAAAWRMAIGDLPAVDADRIRYAPVAVDLADLAAPVAGGVWNGPGTVQFDRALDVHLGGVRRVGTVTVSLDHNDGYVLEAAVDGGFEEIGRVGPSYRSAGMVEYEVDLERPVETDRIRIRVTGGDGSYSAGGMRLTEATDD